MARKKRCRKCSGPLQAVPTYTATYATSSGGAAKVQLMSTVVLNGLRYNTGSTHLLDYNTITALRSIDPGAIRFLDPLAEKQYTESL